MSILDEQVGVSFVLTFSPSRFKSFKTVFMSWGWVKCIDPSAFLFILTPKKSSNVPSSVASNLTYFISLMIFWISF